jgi:putative FmdB family regulatory protein
MPLYEYKCPQCGAQTSVLYSRFAQAQKARVACEACGHKPMRRVLSAVAVHRGSGSERQRSDNRGGAATEDSPKELAETMRRAARGRDMGAEFNEVAARLGKGESANSIEASLRKRRRQKSGPH